MNSGQTLAHYTIIRTLGKDGDKSMQGKITRRQALHRLATLAPAAIMTNAVAADFSIRVKTQEPVADNITEIVPYSSDVLPRGVRSRFVHNVNGLRMHVL